MYLVAVEGGDGSGKGEAVRILKGIAEEFPFPAVCTTHEPRRGSPIGKLALQAVKEMRCNSVTVRPIRYSM